ncbi:MAG: GAF domain-containing protein [Anaerolineales bacterium]|nr:GAF domain-containing protein [Anaerolineales bacterium]
MHPDEKSQKRVEKLFADLNQIARASIATGENKPVATGSASRVKYEALAPSSAIDTSTASHEMDALLLRIRELEAKLKENEKTATPVSLYESEELGYAIRDDHVIPVQMVDSPIEDPDKVIKTPLTASGETIGALKIKPPADRPWTTDEENLANAVAQQVSLQIQNLRLLAATERARAEAQAANRLFTHQSWESFMDGIRNSERIGYVYDQASVTPFKESTPSEADVRETINVLDEHVGNLFLKADPARPLTDEDKAMISSVAQQIAQQVENLRLLADASHARANAEEATRRLTRENWQSFTSQRADSLGYIYDSIQVTPFGETRAPLDITFEQPLKVRGEEIGQLKVAGLKEIPPGALELADTIAEQVSAHIENLRLFELNEKRARELETVAVVSTKASTVLDPDELLQSVVDLTKERFSLYHVHIYLADESWNTLLLASGAGEIGMKMTSIGHAIQMDTQQSLVARAARERSAIIANDITTDQDFLPNPLLPNTRAEMAIPIIVGEKVLGVFDVQSEQAGRFTQEDASTYNTLATQVGIALQNARLYKEQSATVAQLRELDRLKSSFLANMSHELRTPLNSILGFADVMLEELDGPLTPYMDNDLRLIQKNGQHLLHLINDVLDMAKIESGKLNLIIEKFNLHEIMEDVASITSSLAHEKDISLQIDADSDHEVEINADRNRLRQVMINLVNNAMKFTEKGKITIRIAREDSNILISVKDTGIGIHPSQLEAVFQEFTQVDSSTTRKVGGTGLGLPISRRLIEMHGGRLWAESTGVEGEGSTFYVFLPIEAKVVDSEPVMRKN